jgi:hypothetical protein
MTKTVSLTLAQWRMLGRTLRGERLSIVRYNNPTVSALVRKGCWQPQNGSWVPTAFGKRIHACRGVMRAGSQVWDSATPQERSAYGKSQANGVHTLGTREQQLADALLRRMLEAGETR